jgi:hypothetical protein
VSSVTKPRVDQTRPGDLVQLARQGRIRIPRFQRSFRWEREDVTRLFDSIYRGYPIGNLLMWQRPAQQAPIEIGPLSIDAPEVADALWVVDGQQRTTSLVGALAAPDDAVDPRFRIFFDLRAQRFFSVGRRGGIPGYWLPMPVAMSNQAVLQWQRERPGLSNDEMRTCDDVVTAIRDYVIPMYVVQGDDEQALREIFDRLNTFGKRLRRAEVFEALHAVSAEMEPSGLRTLSARVRGFGFGEFSEQLLMQAVLAVREGAIDRDFRNEFASDKDRHQAFVITEQALGHVIDFLRDECAIPHVRLLPYSLYVPVLTRFAALFGPPGDRAVELLRRWIWRGSVVGLPSGTPALRRNAGAVYDDPVASATRLLELVPAGGTPWQPDLGKTRLTSAQAKLNVLALLGQRPRLLLDAENAVAGDPVDIMSLLDAGENPLADIRYALLPSIPPESMTNRLIHPQCSQTDLVAAIASGNLSEETLRSQCMNQHCVELLRNGDIHGFLAHRAYLMGNIIRRNVQQRALFGFRDGPDLRSLFADEEASPDAA